MKALSKLVQFFKNEFFFQANKDKHSEKSITLKYKKTKVNYIRSDPYYLYNPKDNKEKIEKWMIGFSRDWYVISAHDYLNIINAKKNIIETLILPEFI